MTLRKHLQQAVFRARTPPRVRTVVVGLAVPLLLITGCATVESQSTSIVPAEGDSPPALWAAAAVPDGEQPSTPVARDGKVTTEGLALRALWNEPQVDAYNNIQEYLERNSDDNGGVSVVESDYLIIHLRDGITATAELDALVTTATAAGATVEFDRVQRSLTELLKIQYFDIFEEIDSPLFAGTKVLAWGVQPDTNSVEVTVTESTAALGERVFAEFGGAVTVLQGVDYHFSVPSGRHPVEGSPPK